MTQLEQALRGLLLSVLLLHVDTQDVKCIFQPSLNNGILEIPFNSYALFICEHRAELNRNNWYIERVTNLEHNMDPEIQHNVRNNVTCLYNNSIVCDRITVVFIRLSNDHDNKVARICTIVESLIHCSESFTLRLNHEQDIVASTPTIGTSLTLTMNTGIVSTSTDTPNQSTSQVPSPTQTIAYFVTSSTTFSTETQVLCPVIQSTLWVLQTPTAVTDEIHNIHMKVDRSGIQQYINTGVSAVILLSLTVTLFIILYRKTTRDAYPYTGSHPPPPPTTSASLNLLS